MKIIKNTITALLIVIVFTSCNQDKQTINEMIIYSVTTKVDNSILDEWLAWVNGHIEHVLETNRFSKATLSKVNGLDDSEGSTYNVQFWAYSAESLETYRKEDAPAIKASTLKRFPKGLTNTRDEYTVVKEFKNQ